VENYRVISLLNACYKLCSKILNEKLIVQAESSIWFARMDFEKAHCTLIHCLLFNYLEKKEESLIWKSARGC